MTTLLHILAHPDTEHSHTARIANAFVGSYGESHPGAKVTTLALYAESIPHLTSAHLAAVSWHGEPNAMPEEMRHAWEDILTRVTQFVTADHYLVSTPMWNFGVPSILKAYIDHIVIADYTFQYTGPGMSSGILGGKKMVLITTRGGNYSEPPLAKYEMCLQYLYNIFDFLGIDVTAEIVAEGMALVGHHEQEAIVNAAVEKARLAAVEM